MVINAAVRRRFGKLIPDLQVNLIQPTVTAVDEVPRARGVTTSPPESNALHGLDQLLSLTVVPLLSEWSGVLVIHAVRGPRTLLSHTEAVKLKSAEVRVSNTITWTMTVCNNRIALTANLLMLNGNLVVEHDDRARQSIVKHAAVGLHNNPIKVTEKHNYRYTRGLVIQASLAFRIALDTELQDLQ